MKTTIYSNYNLDDNYDETRQFIIDEYPWLCDEAKNADDSISLVPSEKTIWDFINDNDSINWDDTFNEVKNFFADKTVIMFGSIGRWNGNFCGGSIGDFETLFRDLMKDCDYVELLDDNGHFYINCSHHDGSNSMQVKILSERGKTFAENWEYDYSSKYDFDEQTLHEKIATNNFLSALPHFARNVYGI